MKTKLLSLILTVILLPTSMASLNIMVYAAPTPTPTPTPPVMWDTWVTYDSNGGVGGGYTGEWLCNGDPPYTVKTPEAVQISRFGYTFVTWNSEADGSGTDYLPGTVLDSEKVPAVFYAIWTPTVPLIDTSWYTGHESNESYTIYTADQLAGLAQLVNGGNNFADKTIILGSDIDLSDYGENWNDGKGWAPIGDFHGGSIVFSGIFDGNNKTITGLYINNSGSDYVGLFGVSSGTVKNLNIESANITGRSYVGDIAGSAGNIENCSVTGMISGSDNVGGIAGRAGSIKNCSVTGAITGSDTVGGIAGDISYGSIEDCYTNCTVSGSTKVGGVIGFVFDDCVTRCYTAGTVSGLEYIGGVAGYLSGIGSITNCYATSAVNGNIDVGGMAGFVGGGYIFIPEDPPTNGVMKNCYVTGTISGDENVGGIAGSFYEVSLINCAALSSSVNGNINTGRVIGSVEELDSLPQGTISGNRAFIGMSNDEGMFMYYQLDGADMSMAEALTATFWIGTMGWDTDIWDIADGRLPTLKNLCTSLIITTSKAVRVEGNIVLTVNTDVDIPDDNFIHVALYDDNKLVDYILVPVLEEEQGLKHFYVVFKDIEGADFAKVFIWKDGMEPVSIADKISIVSFE